MLISRSILAVVFAGVAQAISHADPPYFPANCKAPSVTPEIRDLPARDFFGKTVYPCVRVGETCQSSKDCKSPPASECHKERTDRKGIFPLPARCIDGFCRILSNKKESPCDCLAGCDLKDFDRDLSCIDGRCKAAECAPCGEFPNNRACCAPGVKGQDGKCFCGTGAGEGCATNPEKCDAGEFNDTCCGRGTDNEGKCCASGSCNGIQSNIVASSQYASTEVKGRKLLDEGAIYASLPRVVTTCPELGLVAVRAQSLKNRKHVLKLAALHHVDLRTCVGFRDGHIATAHIFEDFHNQWDWAKDEVQPGRPWWKVIVLGRRQVLFIFHHMFSDGRFGLMFHDALLQAMNSWEPGTGPVRRIIKINPQDVRLTSEVEDFWFQKKF